MTGTILDDDRAASPHWAQGRCGVCGSWSLLPDGHKLCLEGEPTGGVVPTPPWEPIPYGRGHIRGRCEFDGGQRSILASPHLVDWPEDVLSWVAHRLGPDIVGALPDEKRQALEGFLAADEYEPAPLPVYDGDAWSCAGCGNKRMTFYGVGDHLCLDCWVGKYEPGDPRGRLVSNYFDRLWSGQQGFAAVGHGIPYAPSIGEYKHTGWDELCFAWPERKADLVATVLALRGERDVYVAPVLRNAPRRVKATAQPSMFLYGEVDQPWSAKHQVMFERIAAPGSFTVRSGGHGRHLYLALDEPVNPDELERMNRRVAAAFGGDAKWDCTALLRPPGSFHHKRRVWHDEPPVLVVVDSEVRRCTR